MKVKRILVSQPLPAIIEKSPFYEMSKKYDIAVSYLPFIKVQGVTLKEYRSQRIEILDHTAVIFTSRTTIDNFFRICEEARVNIPESMKYFCNTEAIALYLQKYIVYRKRKIFFADGVFANFMEMIVKHKEERFLLAVSEPHSDEIPLTMERLKLHFDMVTFARTVANDLSEVKLADYDLLAFYSPSEIAALIKNFGEGTLPMLAIFGEGTARAAKEAGLKISAMAPSPQAPSMVKAIDILLNKLASGEGVEELTVNNSRKAEEFIKAQELKPVKKVRAKRKTAEAVKK